MPPASDVRGRDHGRRGFTPLAGFLAITASVAALFVARVLGVLFVAAR